jgi:hypothetical protein
MVPHMLEDPKIVVASQKDLSCLAYTGGGKSRDLGVFFSLIDIPSEKNPATRIRP